MLKFFSFKGAISREEFARSLALWIGLWAAIVLLMILADLHRDQAVPILMSLMAALMISLVSLGIRRYRDLDKSPWWLLFSFTGVGLAFTLLICLGSKGKKEERVKVEADPLVRVDSTPFNTRPKGRFDRSL